MWMTFSTGHFSDFRIAVHSRALRGTRRQHCRWLGAVSGQLTDCAEMFLMFERLVLDFSG
jgi:hypothetical protein